MIPEPTSKEIDLASLLYTENDILIKHKQEHKSLFTEKLFFDPFNLSPAISFKVTFGKNKKKFIFHSNPKFSPNNNNSALIPFTGNIIIGRMNDEKNHIGLEDPTISRDYHGKFFCEDEIIYYLGNPDKTNTSFLLMKKEKAYPIRNIDIIEIENYYLRIVNLNKESFLATFFQKKVKEETEDKSIAEFKHNFEIEKGPAYFGKTDFPSLENIKFIAEIHLKFWQNGDNICVEDASDVNYTTYIQIKNGEKFAMSDDDVLRLGGCPLKFCLNIKPYQQNLSNQ